MRTYVALTTTLVAGAALAAVALAHLALGTTDAGAGQERARAARLGLAGLEATAQALGAQQAEAHDGRLAVARAVARATRRAGAPAEVERADTAPTPPQALSLEARWLRTDGTVSATVGAAWAAAAARGAREGAWTQGDETWATDGQTPPRVVVRIRGWPAIRPAPDLTAATSGLLALAGEDEAHVATPWTPLLAGVLAALLLAALVRWRVDAPATAALTALARWQRGEAVAPVVVRGDRTARAVAQTVASVLLEVDRRSARAHEQVAADAHRLAAALSAVAQGDLAPSPALAVSAPLTPIAGELSLLRTALAERVATLHQAARTAAAAAHDAHGSESASRSSAQALSQTVDALATHAADAGAAVAARRASTTGALESLAGAAEHLRRAGRELRVRVEQLARRAAELAEASERLSNRAAQTVDADEGLELLASVAAVNDPLEVPGGGRIPASHAQATARRGRAALAELRREAESTAAEHASIARELARATEDTSATIREAPPQAVTVVRDAIGAHLTAAERAGELMGALASTLARLQSARETGATAVAAVAGTRDALARALVDWDLGDELDRAWLVPQPSPDEAASVGLADVLERVAAARQRIDVLVREVEEDADRAVAGA
jgi:hypothetical protein